MNRACTFELLKIKMNVRNMKRNQKKLVNEKQETKSRKFQNLQLIGSYWVSITQIVKKECGTYILF